MSDKGFFYATGRRKNAVARVRLLPGEGAIVINGQPYEKMFPHERFRNLILEPLKVTDNESKFGVSVKVTGGGCAGQAGAISLGIARALVSADENLRTVLRSHGLLTRDPRVKERKKYGLIRARKAKQYTKR